LKNQNQPRTKEVIQTSDLVTHIKRENLEWLSHVIRINQTGVAKKVSESNPESGKVHTEMAGKCSR
jgi:hypothetical protein